MKYQTLEALCLKMQRIENRHPIDYLQNAQWQALYKQREELSIKLVEAELEYQKRKLERLNGRDTEKATRLIRQYEKYLQNRKQEKGEQ